MPKNKTTNLMLIPPVRGKEVISHLERFPGIMEEYSEKLNSPNFAQKGISPLTLKTEVEQRALNIIASLFDGNNELKGLLGAVLIGAYCWRNKIQPRRLPLI